jgi:hypothetical protein
MTLPSFLRDVFSEKGSKMQNYSGIVNQVLSEFTSNNVPAAEEETGKAQLTRAAAWEIYKIDSDIGLLQKTSGNNVDGLSVDVIVSKSTGDWTDIATATGVGTPTVTIEAVWITHTGTPPGARWIQPTAQLALKPGPMSRSGSVGPTPPSPTPDPTPGYKEIMDALNVIINTQLVHTDKMNQITSQAAGNMAKMNEHDDNNTDKIIQELRRIVEDMEETLKKAMVLLLANRDPGEPILPIRPEDIDKAFRNVKQQPLPLAPKSKK